MKNITQDDFKLSDLSLEIIRQIAHNYRSQNNPQTNICLN